MRDLYSDDYESVAGGGPDRLISERVRNLAGAVVFVGLIAAMGVWAYRLGTRDASEVPIIRAMEGPARIQPEDPGGIQAAHQGLEVNAVLAGEPAPEPREGDAELPPVVLTDEDGPQGELVVAESPTLPEAALEAEGDLRMPVQEDGPKAYSVEAAPEFQSATVQAEIAAAVAEEVAERQADPAAAPETRPHRRPPNLRDARAAPKPAAEAAKAAPARTPVSEVAALGAGTRLVQLGAFDSEEITRKAWAQLVSRNSDLLSGKDLYVERTTANARVFYRLRVAGFQNVDQTRAMCEALRARGVDCIPVTLQ